MHVKPIVVDELKVMRSFVSSTTAIISDIFCKEAYFLARTLFGFRGSFTKISLLFSVDNNK